MESNLSNIFVLSSKLVKPDEADQSLAKFLSTHDNSFTHVDLSDRDNIDPLCSVENPLIPYEVCKKLELILKNEKKPLNTNKNGNKSAPLTASPKSTKRDEMYEKQWQNSYQKLVQFHQQHGHCNVPRSWKTIGRWVHNQRMQYNNKRPNKLTPSRIKLLEKLGFEWSGMKNTQNGWNQTWENHLKELKKFYHTNGHYNVPQHSPLFIWVSKQKQFCRDFQKGKVTDFKKTRFETLRKLPNFQKRNNSNLKKLQGQDSKTETSTKATINPSVHNKPDNHIVSKYTTPEKQIKKKYPVSKDIAIDKNDDSKLASNCIVEENNKSKPVLENLITNSGKEISPKTHATTDVIMNTTRNSKANNESSMQQQNSYKNGITFREPFQSIETNSKAQFDFNINLSPNETMTMFEYCNHDKIIEPTKTSLGKKNNSEVQISNDFDMNKDVTNHPIQSEQGTSCNFEELSDIQFDSIKEKAKSTAHHNPDTPVASKSDSENRVNVENNISKDVEIQNKKNEPTSKQHSSTMYPIITVKTFQDIEDTYKRFNDILTVTATPHSQRKDLRIRNWQQYYEKVVAFSYIFGHINIPNISRYKHIESLNRWIYRQKTKIQKIKEGDKSEELLLYVEGLETIRLYLEKKIPRLPSYESAPGSIRLENYAQFYVNACFPDRSKINENRINSDNCKNGNSIGGKTDIDKNNQCWQKRFDELVEYKTKNGHCNVPPFFESNQPLAKWVAEHRKLYHLKCEGKESSLTDPRFRSLEKIGFEGYDIHEQVWFDFYRRLLNFSNTFGHCNVPKDFKEDKTLALWANHQKSLCKKFHMGDKKCITPHRLESLQKIGFDSIKTNDKTSVESVLLNENDSDKSVQTSNKYSVIAVDPYSDHIKHVSDDKDEKITPNKNLIFEVRWQKKYEELVRYKNINGNCKLKTSTALGKWLSMQKAKHSIKLLRPDRIRALEKIGVRFNAPQKPNRSNARNDHIWLQRYEQLVAFHRLHGHCEVPRNSEHDKSLYLWVKVQRSNHSAKILSLQRFQALEKLGFKWQLRKPEKKQSPSPAVSQIEDDSVLAFM